MSLIKVTDDTDVNVSIIALLNTRVEFGFPTQLLQSDTFDIVIISVKVWVVSADMDGCNDGVKLIGIVDGHEEGTMDGLFVGRGKG